MKQIRQSIFETNSSSTHSITIASKKDFDDWVSGRVVFKRYEKDKFVELKNDEKESDFSCESFDRYKSTDTSYFEKHFTTESGDKIVAFGTYGCQN